MFKCDCNKYMEIELIDIEGASIEINFRCKCGLGNTIDDAYNYAEVEDFLNTMQRIYNEKVEERNEEK